MVGKSEYDRPVAPGPPSNRVSPLNTALSSGACQHTDPGECPGVCIARSSWPATRSVSPSLTVRKSLSGCVIRHSTSSAGCSSTGASSASPSSGATVTWSLWPCVHTTATTLRPPTAITMGPRVVRGVEHHDLRVVADDPDVVVDFPTAAVEFERAVGDDALDRAAVHFNTTTERSTSPACILWNASSMSSSPMRSETNFSSGSLPCR